MRVSVRKENRESERERETRKRVSFDCRNIIGRKGKKKEVTVRERESVLEPLCLFLRLPSITPLLLLIPQRRSQARGDRCAPRGRRRTGDDERGWGDGGKRGCFAGATAGAVAAAAIDVALASGKGIRRRLDTTPRSRAACRRGLRVERRLLPLFLWHAFVFPSRDACSRVEREKPFFLSLSLREREGGSGEEGEKNSTSSLSDKKGKTFRSSASVC